MIDIIKHAFEILFSKSNISLLGIFSETERITSAARSKKKNSSGSFKYVAALKQDNTLIPVRFHGNESIDEIKEVFKAELNARNTYL